MKIRTDFVTNSSSSSFVIQITFTDTNGVQYSKLIPDNDEDGVVEANLLCVASELAKAESIDSLLEMLSGSWANDAGGCGNASDEEYDEDEDEYGSRQEYGELFNNFCQQVCDEIGDIRKLKNIELKRIWSAWGEFSTSFLPNLRAGDKLYDLSKALCDSDGATKESARKALAEYLSDCNLELFEPTWPTGFMGTKPCAVISYDRLTDSIDSFAAMVVSRKLPNNDFGEETVSINMLDKTVEATAEYAIGGQDQFWLELQLAAHFPNEEITPELRDELREWLKHGTLFDNPWDIFTEEGYPADYFEAKRIRGEL